MPTRREEVLNALFACLQSFPGATVNLVSPSHVVAPFLEALVLAVDAGLDVPIVYNTGGYDAVETLKLLDGVIDIYMPDMKYADDAIAHELSGVKNYTAVNRAAVREMHRQVGDLVTDGHGIAQHGLLVRHLVLPNGLAGTETVMQFLANEISRDTYVNIMAQYRPCHRAAEFPALCRRLTSGEFSAAVASAREAGLTRAL